MKAIIPVAGVGERMRPHTFVIPKVLLPIAGKPILGHIIEDLLRVNITEITFIIGHLGEQIKNYVSQEYKTVKASFIEQHQRLGLGHAIWTSKDLHVRDSEILIILGDTIFKVDLPELVKQEGNFLALKEVEDPRRFGIAVLDELQEWIIDVEEKPEHPRSKLAIVGIYLIRQPQLLYECLSELIAKNIRTRNEYQLTDGLRLMLKRGAKMKPFMIEGWYDCGTPETLLSTNKELLKMNATIGQLNEYKSRYPEAIIIPPVFISSNAKLSNVIVGPFVSIGDETEIKNSIIVNSIIDKKVKVENLVLRDSIIGSNATVKGTEKIINISAFSETKNL
ncbi:MAG: sugar phosphate nucleotidyltransferase [Candidatus Sumerlaeia bacterium]|nr:sugar phosphate nucleotidyltransferase [Candidatus Sumerlaeia bacterium]